MDQSDKALVFIAELEKLCIKHNVMLCCSMYDNMQIWPLVQGMTPLGDGGYIEDCLDT